MQSSLKSIRTLTILLAILFFTSVVHLFFGYQDLSLPKMLEIFKFQFGSGNYSKELETWAFIVFDLRITSILMCILVGIGLGTSGAILQGLFRNPLVDPGFIGVSSGAALGAILGIMFGNVLEQYIPSFLNPFLISILAIIGSFLTTVIVFGMSKVYSKTNIMVMLLSGIAINALVGSVIGVLISVSSDEQLRTFTFWGMGNLESKNWTQVLISVFFIMASFMFIIKLKRQLDIFMLGDSESYQLGLDVELLKKKVIIISSTMVGISVAFCGMIGFIGLVTPHLIRLIIGPKHNFLIPCSAIMGAILILISELISKKINIPIGVITSALGAPFFIWLIISQKGKIGYSE
tara:strand:+ start:128 stop:1174 length:1047 start_codon:yes stop_codon:yes gene_type:complete